LSRLDKKNDADECIDKTKPDLRNGTHTPDRDSITVYEAGKRWLNCKLFYSTTFTIRTERN
jgi:hypothetical protein